MGQPSPPSRAHAYSAGKGRLIHSTACGGDRAHRRHWRRRADVGRPLPVLGRLARRHPPASTRDSRLTHRHRRPASRHRIRRREHASLSMSPVRVGGGSWCPLSRALGAGSRAALAGRGRGAPAAGGGVRTAGRRGSGAGPACGGRHADRPRLGVRLACYGCSAAHQGGRAACSARPRRPRAAAVAAARRRGRRRSCRRSPRDDAALATASLPRCRGCLRCECGRWAIVGGRPSRAVCWELSWWRAGTGPGAYLLPPVRPFRAKRVPSEAELRWSRLNDGACGGVG